MAHQVELEKTKYRSWVKGNLALKYLKQGIEGFADDVVLQEHERILRNIKHTPGQTCNQCNVRSLKPKHASAVTCRWGLNYNCSCVNRRRKPCPNNVCDAIMGEILDSHDSHHLKPPMPNWKNTDIHEWCTDPWEVAKCFIHSPGYFNKSNASDIDTAGLLHVFINNINLHSHLSCKISGTDVLSKTRRRRNEILNSATMELEDYEVNEFIDDIMIILEDEKELKQRPDALEAVEKLNQLKLGSFIITTRNEVEVCRDAMISITNRSEELKQMIQDAKDDIDQKKTEVSKVVEDKTREALEDALEKQNDSHLLSERLKHVEAVNSAIKQDLKQDNKEETDQKQTDVSEAVDDKAQKTDGDAIKQLEKLLETNQLAIELLKEKLKNVETKYDALKRDNDALKRSLDDAENVHKKQRVEQKEAVPEGYLQVGKIVYNPDKVLGIGCDGTTVFKGKFDLRSVAVKKLLSSRFSLADTEVELLRKCDQHENVIRYFWTEKDSQFIYIALELCADTLASYIEGKSNISLDPITILYQAMSGLAHLHSLNIVHRDVKPQNVLISDSGGKVKAMISDFGLGKKLGDARQSFSRGSGILGTAGWIAPEMLNEKQNATKAVDIFSAGCVLYYVITKGKHPFGEPVWQPVNILTGRYNIDSLDATDLYVRKQLIKTMIDSKPDERPSANAVLKHPLFWSKEKQLAFFLDVYTHIKGESEESDVVKKLKCDEVCIVEKDWMKHIAVELQNDLSTRKYNGHSVKDLLRAIRNKKEHYDQLPVNVQNVLGKVPDEFVQYFTRLFPRLLIHTYSALECCAQEPMLQKYYDDSRPVLP